MKLAPRPQNLEELTFDQSLAFSLYILYKKGHLDLKKKWARLESRRRISLLYPALDCLVFVELEEAVVICSVHFPVFNIRLDDKEQKHVGMIKCRCCIIVSSLSIHTNISNKIFLTWEYFIVSVSLL